MDVSDVTSSVFYIINDLNNWKSKREEQGRPFFMSEIWDSDDNQYINFVQEGGGMLGIALAGFTYILEKMGIRFLGLAGTSAGSINSYLMAAVSQSDMTKSEKILKHLINKDFMDFIDGGKDAKALIKFLGSEGKKSLIRVLSNPILLKNYWDLKSNKGMNPGKKFEDWIDKILIEERISLELNEKHYQGDTKEWNSYTFAEFIHSVSHLIHVYKNDQYFGNFRDFNFEKNQGKALTYLESMVNISNALSAKKVELDWDECITAFHDTFNLICYKHKIKIAGITLEELQVKIKDLNEELYRVRFDDVQKGKQLNVKAPAFKQSIEKYSDLAIIAAELNTQSKVIFPEMACLYFENHETMNPTKLVRASMSVPLLFEPVKLSLKWASPKQNEAYEEIRKKWRNWTYHKGDIPEDVYLVDGGIMSNFPIDAFEEIARKKAKEKKDKEKENDPQQSEKRSGEVINPINHITTIGVKLGIDRIKPKATNSVITLLGQCFDNARTIRDNETINKNVETSDEAIAYIDTSQFNWLDFQMKKEDIIKLFEVGALSAARFIKDFDYINYKKSIESKTSKVVRNALLSEMYQSDYYDNIYEEERYKLQLKYAPQDDLNKIVDQIGLPNSSKHYWIDKNEKNVIKYTTTHNYSDEHDIEVDEKLYQNVLYIQEEGEKLKRELEYTLVPSLKNVMIRIASIRNCFDMIALEELNKFPVLWLAESIDFNERYPYNELLRDVIDFSGGLIDFINRVEELDKRKYDYIGYYLIIIKAYKADLNNKNLKIWEKVLTEYPAGRNVIAYVPDWDSPVYFDPNYNLSIYNNRADLLHRVLDEFQRNVYTVG